MQKASFLDEEGEEEKPVDAKQAPSTEQANGLSPRAKTRQDAGFSLDKDKDKDKDKDEKPSPEAGTIGASQAKHTAQRSRTQMMQGADAALAAQARRLSPNVLVLLY